ncbi:MAG: hypothetical protein QNJ47_28180 [Nostocaceae cyanobacterium]|nr:hypothetical protein [Nostocaceae cyanobacterium]
MSKKLKKSINLWTEKHERFCLENKIPPAAQRLWQWLLWQGEMGSEIEPDLKEFNQWVAKWRGKKYDQGYVKTIFNILLEKRVINVVKGFTWAVYRLVLRPLEWLFPLKNNTRKNSGYPVESPDLDPSNDSKLVAGTEQQQQDLINTNLSLLEQAGIPFDKKVKEVLTAPTWQVQAAIVLYQIRCKTSEIENPQGWIRQCIRFKYWDDDNSFYQIRQEMILRGDNAARYYTCIEFMFDAQPDDEDYENYEYVPGILGIKIGSNE